MGAPGINSVQQPIYESRARYSAIFSASDDSIDKSRRNIRQLSPSFPDIRSPKGGTLALQVATSNRKNSLWLCCDKSKVLISEFFFHLMSLHLVVTKIH